MKSRNRLNRADERTVVYAGEQSTELAGRLEEYGVKTRVVSSLPAEIPAGKTLIVPGQLSRGFSYPVLKFNVCILNRLIAPSAAIENNMMDTSVVIFARTESCENMMCNP